jgi:cyanamide hydratase
MSATQIQQNGWTSVPLDPSKLFNGEPYKNVPGPLLVADIKFPNDDPIVAKVQSYAKEKLPIETFNHSMRVFYFGMKAQIPNKYVCITNIPSHSQRHC